MYFHPQNSVKNTSPYGSVIASRAYASKEYRYGFNGFEKDDEVKGVSYHLSYGDYGYDSRIGRRWNRDPHNYEFTFLSPYVHANNSPIIFIDKDGKLFFLVTGAIGIVANVAIGLYNGERGMDLVKRGAVGFICGAGAGLLTVGAAAVAAGTTLTTAATFTTAQTLGVLGGFGTTYLTMLGGGASLLVGNIVEQGIDLLRGKRESFDGDEAALSFVIGFGVGSLGVPLSGAKDIVKKEIKNRLLAEGINQKVKKRSLNSVVKKTLKLLDQNNGNCGITYKVVNGVIEVVGAVSVGVIEEKVQKEVSNPDVDTQSNNSPEANNESNEGGSGTNSGDDNEE